MSENIFKNEIFNDGRTIHLYFNGAIGLYAAYGISAYLLCKHGYAKPSYSTDMQLPVAVINAEHFEILKNKFGLSKIANNYRCLETNEVVDMDQYEEWAGALRNKS